MLHCLNTSGNLGGGTTYSEITVLERQRAARKKWLHQDDFSSALGEVVAHSMKPDPAFENGWPDFGSPASVFDVVNSDISRSCSGLERELVSPPMCAKETTFKKRKADNNNKLVSESKRIKVVEEVESKTTEQTGNKKNIAKSSNANKNKKENSVDTNSKGSEIQIQNQKTDYIHVRARRGQATDSHSLAERVRREKISERMKYLQDLVPGCNKIAGKAGMLDEIINYVQSLQRQVEFLSMKLATVNPRLDFNIDEFFAKELFPQSFPTIGMMQQDHLSYHHQFNSAQQQLVSCYGGLITQDMGLRRNITTTTTLPVSLPEMFLDSSCFTQQQHILPSSTWEGDFQSVAFDQQRSTSFPSHHPFTGLVEASNLKMEM